MGKVTLIGAGPGDPELLTLKAVRRLETANAVVYDRLVSAEILDFLPAGCVRVYAGKARGNHHLTQPEINQLLFRLTRQHAHVVRLKGGDPFLFGRGGEEMLYLQQRGIEVEVVPGITTAAATAGFGFPLTHRGLANSVTFVTGNAHDDNLPDFDWHALANESTTVVVYMGLRNLTRIATRLRASGRRDDTPVALLQNVSTPRQRLHLTTLARLEHDPHVASFEAPTLIVIGRVVELAETRSAEQVATPSWARAMEQAHA
ncbi:MAG: uroporphyrinogen-III C-methyltransferase [Thiotrichales bacterium]